MSNNQKNTYVLQTGSAGAERLNLLDVIYGTATRAMLQDAGLQAGMRVLDVGCGTGAIARFIAEMVGPQAVLDENVLLRVARMTQVWGHRPHR